MKHLPEDCNGGHGCAGPDCCCPCHFDHQDDDDLDEQGTYADPEWEGPEDNMSDVEADADTLRSCGWGTDEDYDLGGTYEY